MLSKESGTIWLYARSHKLVGSSFYLSLGITFYFSRCTYSLHVCELPYKFDVYLMWISSAGVDLGMCQGEFSVDILITRYVPALELFLWSIAKNIHVCACNYLNSTQPLSVECLEKHTPKAAGMGYNFRGGILTILVQRCSVQSKYFTQFISSKPRSVHCFIVVKFYKYLLPHMPKYDSTYCVYYLAHIHKIRYFLWILISFGDTTRVIVAVCQWYLNLCDLVTSYLT